MVQQKFLLLEERLLIPISPNNQTTDSLGNQCFGTYCCKVIDNNGCKDSICVVVSLLTGIGSTSNSSIINIYPNPNTGTFTLSIETKESAGLKFEITDELGQVISEYEDGINGKFSKVINLNNEANGVYFIHISVGNDTFNRKVILVK